MAPERIYTIMKNDYSIIRRFVISLLFLGSLSAYGQKPILLSVDKTTSSTDKVITLKGSQFGTDATKISVRFGAAKANIQLIQDHLLQVIVPPGATHDNISITNTTAGLTAYTREQFLLSFQGQHGFNTANLEGQFNFPTTAPAKDGLNDLCICDFDSDGRNDIGVVNENSGFIMMYPNNSSGPGNISFGNKFAINTFSQTLHIKCADLNGDGKPEIIATEGGSGNKIFILRNTSTGPGSFLFSTQSITISGSQLKQIEVADLDLDGKPELIATSQSTNTIRILPNQSTAAAIIYSTPITFTIAGAVNTDGIAVEDLNGDLIPEIVTAQHVVSSNIFIIKNTSVPGSINLEMGSAITIGSTIKNIRIGDLDGDGKSDISFTAQAPTPQLGTLLNQSTSTSFTFGSPKYFATDGVPYGQDYGDLDGDGKPDIAIASSTKKSLTVLNNTSTPGNINFTQSLKEGLTYISRHIKIGDLDRDGKPDIAFTSVDDNNLSVVASKISVFRNKSCLTPKVTPEGPLNICNTFPQELEATNSNGVTYEWTNHTTSTSVSGTHLFTPSVTGNYQVTATSEGGACISQSNIVNVVVSPGTAADPLPYYDEPLCLGNTLSLKLNNNLGAGYTYQWSGPDGFTASGANPTRTNAQLSYSGEYLLEVTAPGGCVARKESVIVKVIDKPTFTITYPNTEILCAGQFKKLTVEPASADYTYKWFETTAGDLGVTSTFYDIAAGGEYYVKAISGTGCGDIESSKAKIISVSFPVPAFDAPTSACKGQEVSFTNQSTSDNQTTAFYSWTFGDGNTSTQQNPMNIYSSIGSKAVVLTIAYKNNTCARSSMPKTISITDAPAIAITNPESLYDLCLDGTLELMVSGTFTSYLWNTGATSSSITINSSGTYSVEATAPNGCELKAIRTIGDFPQPTVLTSATPPVVEEGESSQLYAEGLQTYFWEPTESLSDPASANPIATPLTSMVYTVRGFDINNCEGTGTIEVTVKGDAIVSKLNPSNFFSPNADAVNPYWLVEAIQEYPQCGVTIYDDKGFKVYEAKPYLENWDGTHNGKRLPDGVYYYVIRCDGEESTPRMGSITVLR